MYILIHDIIGGINNLLCHERNNFCLESQELNVLSASKVKLVNNHLNIENN